MKNKDIFISFAQKGGVVNTVVAIATAKALIKKSDDEHLNLIDIDRCFWAKSLFCRMCFVKRAARRYLMEAELLFHHEIVSKVEKYKTPYSMILNMDQSPIKICYCFHLQPS